MKDIAIQLDSGSLRKAEDFVAAICYDNHLDNYHATIAVPVIGAVEQVMQYQDSNAPVPAPVSLLCKYCQEGISFTVTGAVSAFSEDALNDANSADALRDAVAVAHLLADKVEVLNDGCALRMFFFVQGIDSSECSRRISVIKHFYVSKCVEV